MEQQEVRRTNRNSHADVTLPFAMSRRLCHRGLPGSKHYPHGHFDVCTFSVSAGRTLLVGVSIFTVVEQLQQRSVRYVRTWYMVSQKIILAKPVHVIY